MTHEEALGFARTWIATWNSRDLEKMLGFFADDVVFTSPKASERVGRPTVHGKAALRAYWSLALAQQPALHFVLDRALWDTQRRELAIVYTGHRDGQRHRSCEILRFGAAGLIVAGEAMYGALLPGDDTALA
jgi:hypothetical protein